MSLNIVKHESKTINNEGLITGYEDVDTIIGKFKPKELSVIAARVGYGKTSFILGSVLANLKENNNILYFSLDLVEIELYKRMVSLIDFIPFSEIKNAQEFLSKALEKYKDIFNNLYIDDTKYPTLEYIQQTSKAMAVANNIKIIVIDHYQLIEKSKDVNTIRLLKKLAIELNIPIVVLSQLNRQIDARADRTPYLRDLEDKNIELDADTILLIDIPNFYYQEQEAIIAANERLKQINYESTYIKQRTVPANIIVAKNKYTSTTMKFDFFHEAGRFFHHPFLLHYNSTLEDKSFDGFIGEIVDREDTYFHYSTGISKDIAEDISTLFVDVEDLETIPEDIYALKNLKELFIQHNSLKEISPQIKRLKHLKNICFTDNKLESLPNYISELNELRVLGIHNNPTLQKLPSGFFDLRLTFLNIDGELLNKYIGKMEEMQTLEKISINGGDLSQEVFKVLSQLYELKKIEITSIKNETIPTSIGNLSLQTFFDSNKKIVYEVDKF